MTYPIQPGSPFPGSRNWVNKKKKKINKKITLKMVTSEMNNNLLIQKYSPYNTQPYGHSAFLRKRKNSKTLRSFQFSLGPNFKKKARWSKILKHMESFLQNSYLIYQPLRISTINRRHTHFHFPTTKTR